MALTDKKLEAEQKHSLFCVSCGSGDFKTPRTNGTDIVDAIIGNDINSLLLDAKRDDWVDDEVIVYQLVPVGRLKKGKWRFEDLKSKSHI